MRVNTSWAFAGSSVYAGCQWAVLVLLVKSLSQHEVGAFAYGLAVTAPIFVLANVRLRMLLATLKGSRHDALATLKGSRHTLQGSRHASEGSRHDRMATLKGSRHASEGSRHEGLATLKGSRHTLQGSRHDRMATLKGSRHTLQGSRHASEGSRHTHSPDFSDFLTARLLTTAAAAMASVVLAAFASPAPGAALVIVLIAAARSCDAVSDICHGLFQRELDMRTPSLGLMLNGAASVLLVAISLTLSHSVIGAALAYAAGSAIALLAWDLPRVGRLAPVGGAILRVRWPVLRALLTPALPLGLSSAIGSVQSNLPRYVVAASLGPAPLAVFAALSQIPMLGHLVVNAASQAALPLFARDAGQQRSSYHARLGALVAASVVSGVALVAAMAVGGAWLLRLLYGAAYADHAGVLLWLTAAAAVTFVSVFLGTAVAASGRFGAQAAISATALAVVAASIWPLVSRYGLNGAAGALVAGALVELGAYAALTLRGMRRAEPAPLPMPAALVGSVQP